jgi:homopolymeric O-antigen transport system permease protein
MNPHQQHRTSVLEIARSFWRNRGLIWQMTRREVVGRYRGSVMGLAWSFFNPVLMLVVYTFVFSVVFKARWGVSADESKTDFAIILFVGMIVHGLFAECINRAPGLILSNVNYVKKVVFPLETLPIIAMGSALFHTFVSLTVLLAGFLLLNGHLHSTVLLVPIVLLPLIIFSLGIAWFLASLGVYARDISQITGTVTTVMMFFAPVFYPVSALSRELQPWVMANPLTLVIEEARAVLIWGRAPNWSGLAIFSLASVAVAFMGFWWFQKTRKGFADVV